MKDEKNVTHLRYNVINFEKFFFRYILAKKRGLDLKFGMWIEGGRDQDYFTITLLLRLVH